jgi:hypothetical protein
VSRGVSTDPQGREGSRGCFRRSDILVRDEISPQPSVKPLDIPSVGFPSKSMEFILLMILGQSYTSMDKIFGRVEEWKMRNLRSEKMKRIVGGKRTLAPELGP